MSTRGPTVNLDRPYVDPMRVSLTRYQQLCAWFDGGMIRNEATGLYFVTEVGDLLGPYSTLEYCGNALDTYTRYLEHGPKVVPTIVKDHHGCQRSSKVWLRA